MSYDVRKIPKSMQNSTIVSQVTGAAVAKARNKPSGRDPMKYRPNGTNLAIHRNENGRWLETHLWHAKRFHLTQLWGWKVPIAPTMKQTRNLISMTGESCTMRDVSYNIVFSLTSPHDELVEKFRTMVKPGAYFETGLYKLATVELFKDGVALGPVQAFWVSSDCMWVIAHPVLKDSLLSCFSDLFTVEVIEGELNMFEVLGPLSTGAITSVLHPVPETPAELVSTICALPAPGACPPGLSIAWTAHDPRSVSDDMVIAKPSAAPLNIFATPLPEALCQSCLFTNRTVEFKSEAEFNEERSKLLFPKAEGPSGAIPIVMMQFPGINARSYGSGWLLLTPFGTGKAVFRKLVHKGVRVFGLECSKKIDLEAERFNFPYDRIDTHDGRMVISEEMQTLIAENEAKPKGKRRDIHFYEFPESFSISTEDAETSYLKVGVVMASRGTPSRFSTIYMPEPEDYQKLGQIVEIKGDRCAIGMIMNGNNSLLAGEGKAIGVVSTRALLGALCAREEQCGFAEQNRPKDARLALVREQGSQFLHLAWIYPHASNFYP